MSVLQCSILSEVRLTAKDAQTIESFQCIRKNGEIGDRNAIGTSMPYDLLTAKGKPAMLAGFAWLRRCHLRSQAKPAKQVAYVAP